MSSSASNVSLIVASLGLAEVQAVVGAIRTADLASAAQAVVAANPPIADGLTRGESHPNPCYAPRQVIHPTPRYEPRPVLHPAPRIEPQSYAGASSKSRPPHITPGPPPPWEILPQAQTVVPIAQHIKIVPCQPDYIDRGRLIDLFM